MEAIRIAIDWETMELSFPTETNPARWVGDSFMSTNVDNDTTSRKYHAADIENDGRWVAVLGDIHSSVDALNRAVKACKAANIKHMFQVGDFGYLFSYNSSKAPNRDYPDMAMDVILKEAKDEFGFTLHVIDGNHDNHDVWHRGNKSKEPRRITTDFDDFEVPSMPLYHPRGNVDVIDLDGGFDSEGNEFGPKRFAVGFLGGARSVNVLPHEEEIAEGVYYWYDEEPRTEDVVSLMANADRLKRDQGVDVDLMITHDAPSKHYLNAGLRISNHMEALTARTRNRIYRAVEDVAPELLIHGHWHQWATSVFNGEQNTDTKLLCLPAENSSGNLVFLNSETKEILIPRGYAKPAGDVSMFSFVSEEGYIKVVG